MFFNTKLVLGACFAAVALAFPAELQARAALNDDWRDLGDAYLRFAKAAPQWDGTEAGIDALDGRLWDVSNLLNNLKTQIPPGDTSNYSPLKYVIENGFLTAAKAGHELATKANAKNPAFRDKIFMYWHSQIYPYSDIFRTGSYDALKNEFADNYGLVVEFPGWG